MKTSISKHRKVLISSGEIGGLEAVVRQLRADCSQVQIYEAFTYDEGLQLLLSLSFDLFISHVDFQARNDLIDLALDRKVPVLVIHNGKEPPDFVKRLGSLRLESISSQQEVGEVACDIEKVLASQCMPRWTRLLNAVDKSAVWLVSKLSPRKPGQAWFY